MGDNNMSATDNETHKFKNRCTDCAYCGKNFCIQDRSAYRYKAVNGHHKTKYFCSWSCFNNGATQIAESKVKRRW